MFFRAAIALLLAFLLPVSARALVISGDTVWQGRVEVKGDVYVPEGVVLTVAAGTVVTVHKAATTSIDPEFISPATEIMVRGRMKIRGTRARPVLFRAAGSDGEGWAGIVVAGSGRVEAEHARISGAHAAVELLGAELVAAACEFSGNRYGLVAQGGRARAVLSACRVTGNEYGIMAFSGAAVSTDATEVRANRRVQMAKMSSRPAVVAPMEMAAVRPSGPVDRYRDAVLAGDTVWKGRVVIEGTVRVPDTARLIILPGAEISFAFRDTNGDGIGESGIQVQGAIIAKGRPEAPIVFRAASGSRAGLWDAINILGSDRTRNLIEYCLIENAYRGLHLHFANAGVSHTVFCRNFRGAQFQESLVSFDNVDFHDNSSAIQARDSDLSIRASRVFANLAGVNLFRVRLDAARSIIANNMRSGLRIREGTARIENNLIAANRTGISISDLYSGSFTANVVHANLETGILCRRSDGISINGNIITRNRGDGVRFMDARAQASGNLIAANGWQGVRAERFSGVLQNNNITANQGYAAGIEGGMDLDAPDNWWGGDDVAAAVWDGEDVPGRGRVRIGGIRKEPVAVAWSLDAVRVDAVWAGKVLVPARPRPLTVVRGASVSVRPGTVAAFAAGAGLKVYGDLIARGTAEKRIRFTSAGTKRPASWGEISIERSQASAVENCDFEYATWGMHCHFVPITIRGCRFMDGDGGIRFRSGPMRIVNNLFLRNRIGIRGFFPEVTIAENEFRDNEIAVFIRQGGGGAELHRNNFIASRRYDLRLGDFNNEDVDAAGNYFDGPPQVFDGRREPGIGMARLGRMLAKPLKVLSWLPEN